MYSFTSLTLEEFKKYNGCLIWSGDLGDLLVDCKDDYILTKYGSFSKDWVFCHGKLYYTIPFNLNKNNWTAKWMKTSNYNTGEISFYCSNCEFPTGYKSNYCPKCGKAMNKKAWENLVDNFIFDICQIEEK